MVDGGGAHADRVQQGKRADARPVEPEAGIVQHDSPEPRLRRHAGAIGPAMTAGQHDAATMAGLHMGNRVDDDHGVSRGLAVTP